MTLKTHRISRRELNLIIEVIFSKTSSCMALAPACVPFPPSTKSILIPLSCHKILKFISKQSHYFENIKEDEARNKKQTSIYTSMLSTISLTVGPPRETPSKLPPDRWIFWTTFLDNWCDISNHSKFYQACKRNKYVSSKVIKTVTNKPYPSF